MVCYNRQFDRPKCFHPNPDHTGACLNLAGWDHTKPGLRVVDGIDDTRSQKIFWAEVREWHPTGRHYIYVTNIGSGSAENALRWYNRGHDSTRKFYLANNATQVREWILRNSSFEFPHIQWIGTQYGPQLRVIELNKIKDKFKEKDMPSLNDDQIVNTIALTRAEKLRRRAERLLDEAEKIESRPSEPLSDDDGCATIWWTMTFNGGSREYTYAATRAGDGLWYTTGPSSPKGYPWEDLVNWIYDRGGDNVTLWFATEWDQLA